jgi:SpoIIAA-like
VGGALFPPLHIVIFRSKPMIEYKNSPDNNVVKIIISGKITEEDFDRVIDRLKLDLERHHKLRVLEEVRHLEGIDPLALWKDIRFGFTHLNDFTHAALVADARWLRTMTDVFINIFPLSVKVKVFDPSQFDEAQNWIVNAA